MQPILVHNGTTTGCHGENDENQFRLSRALLYGESNRKSTARNLRAVIAQLDRARVASSPLLQYANRKHGPMATAVFAQHRHDLFDQLVSWAQLVGEPQLAHAPQPAAAPPAAPVYDRRVVPASGNLPQRGAQRGPRIRFGAPLPPGALSRPTNPDAVSRAISSHNRSIPASPQEAKR